MWSNYVRLDLKHDFFTSQEEMLIINLHAAIVLFSALLCFVETIN
ncbi:hypothetical protein Lalb_Chr21g0319101 [Lupinus albus]|uniref:Uncharacterized protein n=1 Tax=Lupinus albus TaxID=3870 RepID=A0A6A4NLJ0_LUPAL|nr:hypothetical protein Lalb_Chr21g0319101 [Lupinus albus]